MASMTEPEVLVVTDGSGFEKTFDHLHLVIHLGFSFVPAKRAWVWSQLVYAEPDLCGTGRTSCRTPSSSWTLFRRTNSVKTEVCAEPLKSSGSSNRAILVGGGDDENFDEFDEKSWSVWVMAAFCCMLCNCRYCSRIWLWYGKNGKPGKNRSDGAMSGSSGPGKFVLTGSRDPTDLIVCDEDMVKHFRLVHTTWSDWFFFAPDIATTI